MMLELHRAPLTLYRPSSRARAYHSLVARARAFLRRQAGLPDTPDEETPVEGLPPTAPPAEDEDPLRPLSSTLEVSAIDQGVLDQGVLDQSLALLEELASFLNQSLLPGDTFALDSELHQLAFFPRVMPGQHELVAATHHHIHLLRLEPVPEGGLRFLDWKTPIQGQPVGLALQSVGFLGSHELVALTREGLLLHEYRLAPSGPMPLLVVHQSAEVSETPTALGHCIRNSELRSPEGSEGTPSIQLQVLRNADHAVRPVYQLRLREHAAAPWRTVHTAHHPLHNPLFDGKTLFFTARSAQIMAIPDPLSARPSAPVPLISLDTPSPVQALMGEYGPDGFTLMAATADGTLFAIDPETHKLRWKFDSGHSLIAVAPITLHNERLIVVGTPDGLLKLFHPVETSQVWELIHRLLNATGLSLERLMAIATPPLAAVVADGCPQEIAQALGVLRPSDRPYLRLLIIDLAIQAMALQPSSLSALILERIREGLLLAFSAAERGSRLWQSEIIRFLAYQFYRLIHGNPVPFASRTADPPERPVLAMLFSVLERLSTPAYGDARRRLERLLRRLRDEWLGPECYESYRAQYAPDLSLHALSAYNLRVDALKHLALAEGAREPSTQRHHLVRALVATWRRALNPLNRVFSLQGLIQAVQVGGRGAVPSAAAPTEGWLLGLHPGGLRLYRFSEGVPGPAVGESFPVHGGLRLASAPVIEPPCQLIAVARPGRVSFFRFEESGKDGHLYALPIEDLTCDEPVTVLELLQLPTGNVKRPFVTVLAVGQADGRFRLLRIGPTASGFDGATRLQFVPLLEQHWSTPVHHVAIAAWPDSPALLIGADQTLHIYSGIRVRDPVEDRPTDGQDPVEDGDEMAFTLQRLHLESTVTAFTVAAPPPRQGPPPKPVLVIGLANGMVQAFCAATKNGFQPELAWQYRAPQVITDLTYVYDHTGGWFVAAADDGVLHLLRYGEPHHRVAVERYPFDLSPIHLPGYREPFLLVSSPNRAVTVLEVTGNNAHQLLESLGARLTAAVPPGELPEAMEQASDPALIAITLYLMRNSSLSTLQAFVATYADQLHKDAVFSRTWMEILLERAPEEPEARTLAYAFFLGLMQRSDTFSQVKTALLNAIADTLDRIEKTEIDVILTPFPLEDPLVARTYLKLLEHLWDRTHLQQVDDTVWWRGLQRLGVSADTFDRRQLLPAIGTFARKLLKLSRDHVLDRLRYLRELESSGLNLTRVVCEALALPHVLGDEILSRCVQQYGQLLQAHNPIEIRKALQARRDMLAELDEHLPEARDARTVYDDLLEAFAYSEYDQYSRFLVDTSDFLHRARADLAENQAVFQAFGEVRSRLLALAPPQANDRYQLIHFQDRVQTLLAQAEVLLDFARRWTGNGTLEEQTVAAILGEWRENILLPEVRRLQESVDLTLRDLRVVLHEEGGMAEVFVRIHNLGGRPLDRLQVALGASPTNQYLWEGDPEWCQGPIQYGQAVEFRTEILVEDRSERLTLCFDLTWQEQGHEVRRQLLSPTRLEREEGAPAPRSSHSFRVGRPYTFDSLRGHLVRTEAGHLFVLVSEETAYREQLLSEVQESLEQGPDAPRRAVISLDVQSMLEGPPRTSGEALPYWWLTDRVLRALLEKQLITEMPDRSELRADPLTVLDRALFQALEGIQELWFVFRRAHRAFSPLKLSMLEVLRSFLAPILRHASHRIRAVIGGDFTHSVRFMLPPSPLAGRGELLDIDQPFPFDSPRSRAELVEQLGEFLAIAKLYPSELIRNKLLAHVGWNLGLLKRLLGGRVEALRSAPWLSWQRGERDAQGEPEELDAFLNTLCMQSSSHLRTRFASLPMFHRLALCAVASGSYAANRRELREGMVLATDIYTSVKAKGNRPKRLYAAHTLLLDGDAQYLQVTVGETQGKLDIGLFKGLDFSISLSHLLQSIGLPQLLNDLESLGLIRRLVLSGQPMWALRVPILRRWLVKTHPFEAGEEMNFRRRVFEDGHVATLIPLHVFADLNARLTGGRQLLHDFLLFMGLLEEDARRGTHAYELGLKRWDRLNANARRFAQWQNKPSADSFRLIIQEWCSHFKCSLENLEGDLDDGVYGIAIDLSPLRIPRLGRTVLFGLTNELTSLRAERLREILRREGARQTLDEDEMHTGAMGFVLFPLLPAVPGAPPPPSLDAAAERYRELMGDRLIPLTERDLISTALSEEGRREFLELLARGGFRLSHISPYQLNGPLKGKAMDVLFVGREDEIDYVLRHPDQQVAIVGSRRIGKTSLLLKLKQELTAHLSEKARVVYIDCVDLAPHQVWRAITDSLRLEPVALDDARLSLRRQLDAQKHAVVLLLDEIDGLYGTPSQQREEGAERLMWDLRSLATAGALRLIVAGYIRIYERRRDPRSAFHNFTTFRRLSALSVEAARALVRGPISALNLEFVSDSLIDQILERTYRVPWIIQLFCNQLITRLDERLNRSRRFDRRITQEDIGGVSVQIDEELYSHLTNTRVMSSTDQILLLTMVEAGIHSFSERELTEKLEARFGEDVWAVIHYEDLPRALENLTLTLALTVDNGVFSFPLDMYPNVIRSRIGNVRSRLDRLYENLNRSSF